jgi:tetratricopeptide (TPR) repeat protein
MRTQFMIVLTSFLTVAGYSSAQTAPKAPALDASVAAQQGVILAESGRCPEALPLLKKSISQVPDKALRLKVGLATVRCAMLVGRTDAALDALRMLNRDFPHDPGVLYVTTHAYSDLSTRTAVELAQSAPDSYQAHELNAESLEMQGKWENAAAEYRKIIEQNPQMRGMHFRLGRLILSEPGTPTTAADAKKEFEEELKLDPNNAGAEYVLGELARQAQTWDDAIAHFSRACKLDGGFGDAFLGLGLSLNSASRFAEAIPALEKAVKLEPENPAGHFQLTIAYTRAGRKQDAEREMAIYQQTSEKELKREHGEGQADAPATPPQ